MADAWTQSAYISEFGFKADTAALLMELDQWLENMDGTIIVASDPHPCGFLAMFACRTPLSDKLIGLQKYWYSQPGYNCGVRMLAEARRWAISKKCSHFILAASNLASDEHDRIVSMCQKMGMSLFETAYVEVLDGH